MQFHLPEYFYGDLVATVAFGIVAILLIIIGYIAFDKLTPKLDFDDLLNKGNMALGIVIGSFILGLCYVVGRVVAAVDRKSTRLNSSHRCISYAVFCLKKKNKCMY